MSNFSFSRNVFNSCLLLMLQNEYLWSKGLTNMGRSFENIVGKGENAATLSNIPLFLGPKGRGLFNNIAVINGALTHYQTKKI